MCKRICYATNCSYLHFHTLSTIMNLLHAGSFVVVHAHLTAEMLFKFRCAAILIDLWKDMRAVRLKANCTFFNSNELNWENYRQLHSGLIIHTNMFAITAATSRSICCSIRCARYEVTIQRCLHTKQLLHKKYTQYAFRAYAYQIWILIS